MSWLWQNLISSWFLAAVVLVGLGVAAVVRWAARLSKRRH